MISLYLTQLDCFVGCFCLPLGVGKKTEIWCQKLRSSCVFCGVVLFVWNRFQFCEEVALLLLPPRVHYYGSLTGALCKDTAYWAWLIQCTQESNTVIYGALSYIFTEKWVDKFPKTSQRSGVCMCSQSLITYIIGAVTAKWIYHAIWDQVRFAMQLEVMVAS